MRAVTILERPETAAPSRAVVIEQLSVRYGDGLTAIAGLDLEVAPGEFHAILGPSGCGKSTLIKTLAGILRPAAGSAWLGGEASYVPQGNSCFPWLTAEENAAYGLKVQRMSKSERRARAREILSELGLGGSEGRYPHQLSEGMRQRVAIARAFAVDAQVLLMDEPASSLDFQTKLHLHASLLALWERRRPTVIYVTHDIDEALVLADRVTVLSRRPGRAVATIDVPFGRPRDSRLARALPGYGELFTRLLGLIEVDQ
jgi:NitT/TauT family transport system ATP-binding protein